MSEKKPIKSQSSKITGDPNRILVIEENDVDFFTEHTLLKEITHFQNIERKLSYPSVLSDIKKAQKMTEIPNMIFIGMNGKNKEAISFLEEFNKLSDFIKGKCKLVVMSNSLEKDEKFRILLNPSVICYLNKPLEAIQLKNLIINQ